MYIRNPTPDTPWLLKLSKGGWKKGMTDTIAIMHCNVNKPRKGKWFNSSPCKIKCGISMGLQWFDNAFIIHNFKTLSSSNNYHHGHQYRDLDIVVGTLPSSRLLFIKIPPDQPNGLSYFWSWWSWWWSWRWSWWWWMVMDCY